MNDALDCATRFDGRAVDEWPWEPTVETLFPCRAGMCSLTAYNACIWWPARLGLTVADVYTGAPGTHPVRGEAVELPVGELWATQRRVYRQELVAIGGLRRPGFDEPFAVRWADRLYLIDGHHRASIALHIGATRLRGVLIDLQTATTEAAHA